ncbi:hypothetical protein C8J57DRAFT_1433093 [Mycena rebaudengoi]|nr:hypothetical protein C8J57DRAFT_1433093 [Mycena rebaudengoi]
MTSACFFTTPWRHGGGKFAFFAVPIIILREMVQNPASYPDLPVRALPMGLIITPTKGLAANIETVTAARKAGRNLVREIKECKTWNVLCVDPEHLRDKAWREISTSDTFRENLVYGCVDEAHLINQWESDFRVLFKHIGAFFRGRFPSTASIMALSATLQPGAPSDSFPDLIQYLNSGRKAVVHCRTIDIVFRVFVYLWKSQSPGPHRLRRVQMYHSLRFFEDNEEILKLMDEDPLCQVVIATIAFSNGLNIKALLDSISLGFPDSVDQL